MRTGIGAAVRRAVRRVIRVFEKTLSITTILGMSLAPAAGAIAVGYFLNRSSIPVALVAVASLATTVAWRLGFFRNREADCSKGKESSQERAKEPKVVDAPPPDQLTNAMVTFHDFNPARRRFDYW